MEGARRDTDQRMRVVDVMTKDVVEVSPDDDLEAIRRLFDVRRFHHALVVEDGKLWGVISDRDLLRHASPFLGTLAERPQDAATRSRKAHSLMTRKPITIGPDAPMREAARRMLEERVSCLPVVDAGGAVVGVVTSRDVLRWATTAA